METFIKILLETLSTLALGDDNSRNGFLIPSLIVIVVLIISIAILHKH